MAVRFGAAMVSTAIGMLARVLHTGFKVDTNDAVRSVEERAVQSAENLTMAFDAASQQLEVFRDQVRLLPRKQCRAFMSKSPRSLSTAPMLWMRFRQALPVKQRSFRTHP